MREIKFIVFLDGRFYYWGFIDNSFIGLPMSSGESLTMNELQKRSCQYTGLKDKNGKEIYESDKLKTNRGVGEVVWRGMGWLLKIEGHGLFSFQDIDNDLEIVGNKYEN